MLRKASLAGLLIFSFFYSLYGNAGEAKYSKIAVVDMRRALLDSNTVKKDIAEFNKIIAPELKKMKKLQKELESLQKRLTKESDSLSPKQRESLQQDFISKRNSLQSTSESLDKKQQSREQSLMKKFQPIIEKNIGDIMKEKGYTVVLHWQAVVTTSDQADNITQELLSRLNKASK